MRHVDDAHDAEGDGEADRGKQQHRAERQAVPDVLHDIPERKAAVDRVDMRLDLALEVIRRGFHRCRQDRQRVAIAAGGDRVDGGLSCPRR
jgi:hypothetical protein